MTEIIRGCNFSRKRDETNTGSSGDSPSDRVSNRMLGLVVEYWG